jgi:hypothetical protein
MQLAKKKSTARFMTFSVNSKADLDSMRSNLGGIADYFEADLTAFTTTRALHEAVGKGANRSIPTPKIEVIEQVETSSELDHLPGANLDPQGWKGATSES